LKKIEAIVRRERFEQVDAALKSIGVNGLTMEDVRGRGRTRMVTTIYSRGVMTKEDEYIRHYKLEIIVNDNEANKVINAIMSSASTGGVGDGKIFVTSVDDVVDIGSKQTGINALELEKAPVTVSQTSK
jgi:nitrogen regulatory protein P-II 1